jgi:hypothetical protein
LAAADRDAGFVGGSTGEHTGWGSLAEFL